MNKDKKERLETFIRALGYYDSVKIHPKIDLDSIVDDDFIDVIIRLISDFMKDCTYSEVLKFNKCLALTICKAHSEVEK